MIVERERSRISPVVRDVGFRQLRQRDVLPVLDGALKLVEAVHAAPVHRHTRGIARMIDIDQGVIGGMKERHGLPVRGLPRSRAIRTWKGSEIVVKRSI